MAEPLHWFPKRFSPGDMDASGGDRLLGKSELSRLAVVIREMAQNSWDARLDDGQPVFGVALRRTSFQYREALASLLTDGPLADLHGLRRNANLRVLEIYDRGTTGLDGPADLSPTGKEASARFQDLILKFGVSHNDGMTGGTYGFGKTAAFAYSGLGTVVYWTRCRNPEGYLEHRFIVSAFRNSYERHGFQYTGRHWWGRPNDARDSILPVTGPDAAALGEQFFDLGFAANETGTSILILDPLVTDEEDTEDPEADPLHRLSSDPETVEKDFARRARHAIRANLWPKIVPELPGSPAPMRLELRVHETPVDLGAQTTGMLGHWGAGLNAIREMRRTGSSSVKTPSGLPVEVLEVSRYQRAIGHLALVRRIPSMEAPSEDDDLDPASADGRILRIALMRGKAELIVTTVDWVDRTPAPGMDWIAVYKSTDEFDAAYADAEPPAHDNWVSDGAGTESAKIVRHTRSRVSRLIKEEFFPETSMPVVDQDPHRIQLPTGALSRRLGALLPTSAPKPPKGGTPTGGGRRRSSGAAPWIVEAEAPRLISTGKDGRQRQEVTFALRGDGDFGFVKLAASLIGDEGQHETIPLEELDVEWGPGTSSLGEEARVPTGELTYVRFSGAPRRALRITMTGGSVDGRS